MQCRAKHALRSCTESPDGFNTLMQAASIMGDEMRGKANGAYQRDGSLL